MTPEQIAVVAGFIATILIALLKLLPGFNATAAITKIISTVCACVLTVLVAAQWQFNEQVAWQLVLAILTALGSYQAIGKPIREAFTGIKAQVAAQVKHVKKNQPELTRRQMVGAVEKRLAGKNVTITPEVMALIEAALQ